MKKKADAAHKKLLKMTYEKRKSMYGYCFIGLWFAGMLIFFLVPLILSFIYSFENVNPQTGGMNHEWVGLHNYSVAFRKDQYYRKYLVEVLLDAAKTTPLILVFSLQVISVL